MIPACSRESGIEKLQVKEDMHQKGLSTLEPFHQKHPIVLVCVQHREAVLPQAAVQNSKSGRLLWQLLPSRLLHRGPLHSDRGKDGQKSPVILPAIPFADAAYLQAMHWQSPVQLAFPLRPAGALRHAAVALAALAGRPETVLVVGKTCAMRCSYQLYRRHLRDP